MATNSAPHDPYVFISYASADRERVLPLVDALTRAGIGVWIDRDGIHGGANYGEEIAAAIKGAAALVLMTSAASLASRNVKQEIALAWDFERAYVPLLLEAVIIPTEVKYWLTAAQWIEVLDRSEGEWLPLVLTSLAPLGIAPTKQAEQEEIRLAGRERELALLREKLAAARDGNGGLVLIGGEAGIGKTTLAEAVMRDATGEGFAVLEGHCFDLAETPPYGPWIDLFAHLPIAAPLPPLPEAFAARGTVGAVTSQMALFVQVEDFLTALTAQRPVVMLLDDVHWSDPASLDLLRFLSRSVATRALLILVTYRSDELTRRHPLYQLLPHLARDASATRLDLGKLDEAAVRTLVETRYGLPAAEAVRLVAYVLGRTEGNALFVGEMLRTLEEGGTLIQSENGWRCGDVTSAAIPVLLRQVIDGRLGRLDDESQRLLSIAAVIGHEIPLAVWAAVGECSEDALLAVVEEALAARVLVEASSGDGVRFTHALIRETLYEGIPGIRQRRIHRRVAEALAAQSTPDPDAVAFHFQQAGDEHALPWLLQAGERAQAATAWVTAAARFEAALSLMESAGADANERGWLLWQMARLLQYVDLAKARAFADEALALAMTANNDALAASARFSRGLLACYAGDVVYGLSEIEAGVEALARLTETELAWLATRTSLTVESDRRGALALWRAFGGRYREAREAGEQLVAEAVSGDGKYHADVTAGKWSLGEAYAALGMPEQAAAMFASAYDEYLRAGLLANVVYVSANALATVAVPYRTEDIAGRQQEAERAEAAFGRASGAISSFTPPRNVRLPLLVLEGQWDEAEQIAAVVSSDGAGVTPYLTRALGYIASLAQLRGDARRARLAVGQALPKGSATEPGTVGWFSAAIALQEVAAMLALDDGALPTAQRWLEAHDRWLAWSGAVLWQSEGQALWAHYYRQAGDKEQAYACAARALAHATEPRQPLALLAAHRLLGELGTEAGRFDHAERHLIESLALADACAAPYERALTLLAMVELRAATGEKERARILLDEARAICTPLGAKPALARADALSIQWIG